MDEKMSVAESDRKVQTENANADMVVKITKCNGDVKVAQYQGRENADRLVQVRASDTRGACVAVWFGF